MGWGEHIVSYTRKIQENPNDTTAYFNRGETYFNLKQYEAAIRDFSKIIDEITPNFSGYYNEQAYYKRGLAYSCLKQYEKATQDFEKCTIWYHGRGQDYYELEQYELAIQDFSKAIERDSNGIVSYHMRSNSYFKLKQYKNALLDFIEAFKLECDYEFQYGLAYYILGKAYLQLEQYEKAIQNFNKAIKLEPDDKEAYKNRAEAYSKVFGQDGAAIKDYDKAIKRGAVYQQSNMLELAIEDFSRAIELDSSSSEAYFNRSVAYSGLEKYERAISDVSRYIELNPDDAKGYYLRGKCCKNLLEEDFKRAKEMGYEE